MKIAFVVGIFPVISETFILNDHPKRWGEMGRAGRQFVERNYDKEKLNRELVDIYRRLVD